MGELVVVSDVIPGVWAAILRQNRACAACGTESTQVDHVRPRQAAGRSVPVNMAALCETCNKVKSCYWPGHGYHPLPGFDDAALARVILNAELDWLEDVHGEAEVTSSLFGGAGRPGRWHWQAEPAGPWLAAWC